MTQGLSTCIVGDSLDSSCPAILGITSLNCSSKYITDISGIDYFTNLIDFNCSNNMIFSMPELPLGLLNLICLNNQLSNLDNLPPFLKSLNCAVNNLQTLDSLPSTLTFLACGENDLVSINSVFDSL